LEETVTISQTQFSALLEQLNQQGALLQKLAQQPALVPRRVIRNRETVVQVADKLLASHKRQGYFTPRDVIKASTILRPDKFKALDFLIKKNTQSL
jgi:hypothetical protein